MAAEVDSQTKQFEHFKGEIEFQEQEDQATAMKRRALQKTWKEGLDGQVFAK